MLSNRSLSIDALNAQIQSSEVNKELINVELEISNQEFIEMLDYYTVDEIVKFIGVKRLLQEIDTNNIIAYLEEINENIKTNENNKTKSFLSGI